MHPKRPEHQCKMAETTALPKLRTYLHKSRILTPLLHPIRFLSFIGPSHHLGSSYLPNPFGGDDTAAQGHLKPNSAQPTSNRGASSLSFHLLHRRHSLRQVEFATQSLPVKALYILQVFEEENQKATNTNNPNNHNDPPNKTAVPLSTPEMHRFNVWFNLSSLILTPAMVVGFILAFDCTCGVGCHCHSQIQPTCGFGQYSGHSGYGLFA